MSNMVSESLVSVSHLLEHRIIFLGGACTDRLCNDIVAQLLLLQHHGRDPISLYINSPGGALTASLAVIDTMLFVDCPVHTFCIGQAASAGSLILSAGEPGYRFILPHARVMMHQPMGGVQGSAEDMRIHIEEVQRLRRVVEDLYLSFMRCDRATLKPLLERDTFLNAQQAKDLCVVDAIINHA